jgi:hypothetical protein
VHGGQLGGPSDLYSFLPDGTLDRQLTATGDAGEPRWGPGGQRVVYRRLQGADADIYLLDVGAGTSQPLVTGPTYDHQPTFTPDGARVLFVRGRQSSADAEIWSVNLDGSDLQNLSNAPGSREMWPATACLAPELPTPTPTASPTPPPTPTSPPALCICDIVRRRVPQVIVNDALANPDHFYGWGLRLDPGKPAGPANPLRTCLTLQNHNLDFHPLVNRPVWHVGCP